MAPAPVRRRGLSAGAAAGSGPWVGLVVVSGTEVAAALSGLGRLPGDGKDPVPIQDGSPGKGRGGQPPPLPSSPHRVSRADPGAL